MARSYLLLPAFILTLTGMAAAQGSNCGTATAISAPGTYGFDTTTATTSGFAGLCTGGATSITNDVFWQFTVPATGAYTFDTFGSGFDTKLSVHDGLGCASTACLGYNDDVTPTLQSEVLVPNLLAGQVVLVQVGGYNGAFGIGSLNISSSCPGEDGFEENDTCATAAPLLSGSYLGLYIDTTDEKDLYSVSLPSGATMTAAIQFTDALVDLDLFLWEAGDVNCGTAMFGSSELAASYSTTDNESFFYTNNTGACQDLILEVDTYAAGTQACLTYDLSISGAAPCGVSPTFCSAGFINSTGGFTLLTGTPTSAGAGLHLEITGGPAGELGYLLVGTGVASTPTIQFGNGLLCLGFLGFDIARYNFGPGPLNSIGVFDSSNVFQSIFNGGSGFDVPVNTPLSTVPTISPGTTLHFQAWHRDTPAGPGQSNTSTGVSYTF